jgi:hypothetical protein
MTVAARNGAWEYTFCAQQPLWVALASPQPSPQPCLENNWVHSALSLHPHTHVDGAIHPEHNEVDFIVSLNVEWA